jgi:hypothetical protein
MAVKQADLALVRESILRLVPEGTQIQFFFPAMATKHSAMTNQRIIAVAADAIYEFQGTAGVNFGIGKKMITAKQILRTLPRGTHFGPLARTFWTTPNYRTELAGEELMLRPQHIQFAQRLDSIAA